MSKTEKLIPGKFYHIYNHAVGGRDLFLDAEHYEHFLFLYDKFVEPIANTYAWALMPNHFHFLVRIKENRVYKYSNPDKSMDEKEFNEVKWQTIDLSEAGHDDNVIESLKIPKPEKHFSHCFNSYSRYFNTRIRKSGNLFNRPFDRKLIGNSTYLKNVVLYIHNNPVHHGFCEHPVEYPWTSYLTCVSIKPTKLKRDVVQGWFSKDGEFTTMHNEKFNWYEFEKWLGI